MRKIRVSSVISRLRPLLSLEFIVPAAIWIYFVACFAISPNSNVHRGLLPDPDDYMYLAHIGDWLGGQSWFDITQHKLNPPEGTPIYFSRLYEAPMALIVLFLSLFMKEGWAGLTMTVIVPPMLFAGLLATLSWIARGLLPPHRSFAVCFVALFLSSLTWQFVPGHIDHHGVIVLIVALTFGCLAKLLRNPDKIIWAYGAGICAAYGLVIALEILPWLIAITVCVGFWSIIIGGSAAKAGFNFGVGFSIASMAFLLITRSPDVWFDCEDLNYSLTYVVFAIGTALSLGAIALTASRRLEIRLIAAIVATSLIGWGFISLFPQLLTGPYGAMDPLLKHYLLTHTEEATPLLHFGLSPVEFLLCVFLPCIGLLANLVLIANHKGAARWLWGWLAVLQITGFLLVLYLGVRFSGATLMFSTLPLGALLAEGWDDIGAYLKGWRSYLPRLILVLLIGPLTTVIIPTALNKDDDFSPLTFPVQKAEDTCNLPAIIGELDDPHLTHKQQLIINSITIGPALLFETPHVVLSAPFHEDISGNIDSAVFFGTPDIDQAKAIAYRRQADLVVMCNTANTGNNGPNGKTSFAGMLLSGKVPKWLQRISPPGERDYLLFRVVHNDTSKS